MRISPEAIYLALLDPRRTAIHPDTAVAHRSSDATPEAGPKA
jgi:hypothetical protein